LRFASSIVSRLISVTAPLPSSPLSPSWERVRARARGVGRLRQARTQPHTLTPSPAPPRPYAPRGPPYRHTHVQKRHLHVAPSQRRRPRRSPRQRPPASWLA